MSRKLRLCNTFIKSAHIETGFGDKREKFAAVKVGKGDLGICQCELESPTRTWECISEWFGLEWCPGNCDRSNYCHGIFAITVERVRFNFSQGCWCCEYIQFVATPADSKLSERYELATNCSTIHVHRLLPCNSQYNLLTTQWHIACSRQRLSSGTLSCFSIRSFLRDESIFRGSNFRFRSINRGELDQLRGDLSQPNIEFSIAP